MKLTDEEKEILKLNSHMSNEEINKDIRDTQSEIDIIIYNIKVAKSGISKRAALNKRLTRILELRLAQT